MPRHPLKGLYLLRYGSDAPGADHTKSVLDPPESIRLEDATEQNQSFVQHSLDKLQKFSPIDRSKFKVDDDFAQNYINARRNTEIALREALPAKGVEPEDPHALYFFLHNELNPDPPLMAGKKVVIAIPAENIPEHLVSFTVDDSFHFFDTSGRLPDSDRGKILNSADMAQRLEAKGWLPSTPDKPRFYEAQLWSRRIEDFNPTIMPHSKAGEGLAMAQPQQQQQAQPVYAQEPTTPSAIRRGPAPTFKPA